MWALSSNRICSKYLLVPRQAATLSLQHDASRVTVRPPSLPVLVGWRKLTMQTISVEESILTLNEPPGGLWDDES